MPPFKDVEYSLELFETAGALFDSDRASSDFPCSSTSTRRSPYLFRCGSAWCVIVVDGKRAQRRELQIDTVLPFRPRSCVVWQTDSGVVRHPLDDLTDASHISLRMGPARGHTEPGAPPPAAHSRQMAIATPRSIGPMKMPTNPNAASPPITPNITRINGTRVTLLISSGRNTLSVGCTRKAPQRAGRCPSIQNLSPAATNQSEPKQPPILPAVVA